MCRHSFRSAGPCPADGGWTCLSERPPPRPWPRGKVPGRRVARAGIVSGGPRPGRRHPELGDQPESRQRRHQRPASSSRCWSKSPPPPAGTSSSNRTPPRTVSAKFDRLPPGEALHLLLRDLNFALVPATNASPKLFVFRTTMQNATQSVRPAHPAASASKGKLIPNELIVRLKPGAKIDDLAKLLGAKVTGRIDSLNAYRLQFEDQAAADAARQQLACNPDVASVDSNYSIDRPPAPAGAQGSNLPPPPQLQLKPPPSDGRIIVGPGGYRASAARQRPGQLPAQGRSPSRATPSRTRMTPPTAPRWPRRFCAAWPR